MGSNVFDVISGLVEAKTGNNINTIMSQSLLGLF